MTYYIIYEHFFVTMIIITVVVCTLYSLFHKSLENKIEIVVSNPDNGDCFIAYAVENFEISTEGIDIKNVRLQKF